MPAEGKKYKLEDCSLHALSSLQYRAGLSASNVLFPRKSLFSTNQEGGSETETQEKQLPE